MINLHERGRELSVMSRRRFIQASAAFIGITACGAQEFGKILASEKSSIIIGMFADSHYADREMRINRHYRDSLAKVQECIKQFNAAGLDIQAVQGHTSLPVEAKRWTGVCCMAVYEREAGLGKDSRRL